MGPSGVPIGPINEPLDAALLNAYCSGCFLNLIHIKVCFAIEELGISWPIYVLCRHAVKHQSIIQSVTWNVDGDNW